MYVENHVSNTSQLPAFAPLRSLTCIVSPQDALGREEWMDTTPVDSLTAEQQIQLAAHAERVAALAEARSKYRNALSAELIKLITEHREASAAFEEKVRLACTRVLMSYMPFLFNLRLYIVRHACPCAGGCIGPLACLS